MTKVVKSDLKWSKEVKSDQKCSKEVRSGDKWSELPQNVGDKQKIGHILCVGYLSFLKLIKVQLYTVNTLKFV